MQVETVAIGEFTQPIEVDQLQQCRGIGIDGVVVDPDHHAFTPFAEMRRQPAERLGGDGLELGERRRLERPPVQRIGQAIGHGAA